MLFLSLAGDTCSCIQGLSIAHANNSIKGLVGARARVMAHMKPKGFADFFFAYCQFYQNIEAKTILISLLWYLGDLDKLPE